MFPNLAIFLQDDRGRKGKIPGKRIMDKRASLASSHLPLKPKNYTTGACMKDWALQVKEQKKSNLPISTLPPNLQVFREWIILYPDKWKKEKTGQVSHAKVILLS